ncbi:MAG: sensor histidine kinase, partial [Acidimicrobiia bacterium]
KETELASIVYSMANPVLVVDPGGHLLIANPASEEVFGFSSDWVKGTHVSRLLEEPQLIALLTGDIEGPIEVEAGRQHAQIWKARVSSVTSPDINKRGRLLVLEDVTSDRETQRLKSDFVSVVGHELRTPLTSIKGYLRTLVTRGDRLTEDQRREALITADAQTARLERLIENLLYVSAIESTPTLHLESVDLMDSVGVLVDEFRVREVQRPVSAFGPASLKILLDKTKVEQVLFHLIDNACKYSEAEAPVNIEVMDHPDRVSVAVTDKGVGILSGDIPKLFERFHQIDASSTREHEGAGLGLYICKRFIDAHGGDIEVESAWGQGSTFTVSIPKNLAVEIRRKAQARPSLG